MAIKFVQTSMATDAQNGLVQQTVDLDKLVKVVTAIISLFVIFISDYTLLFYKTSFLG